MPRPHLAAAALLAAGLVGSAAILSHAGPLSPPAGAPTSTYKTLAEVEPRIPISAATTPGDGDALFKITQPGSYYLTGNITGVSGRMGIEIAAGRVTIDLNGFELRGVAGSFYGIATTGVYSNLTIRNGAVIGWGIDGINLATGGTAAGSLVTGVHASGNSGVGIGVNNSAVLKDCTATGTGGIGIYARSSAVIESCAADSNGGEGIVADFSATISRCASYLNSGYGIWANAQSIVVDCTVTSNALGGIVLNGTSLARGNSSSGHTSTNAAGILVQSGANRVEGNNCTLNSRGVRVTSGGNFITRNTCAGNGANWDIAAGNNCLVVAAVDNPGSILGNAGGVSPGSSDPNANFSY